MKNKLLFLIIFVMLFSGCSSITCTEREAHFVNANRYIPMLEQYILNDTLIEEPLKETYIMALEEWSRLIISKYEECD